MDYLKLGKAGERIAVSFLQKNGYQIITTNFRTKFGEIDVIAKENEVLVFVEVKCRSDLQFGYPFEAVTKGKLRQIAKAGEIYQFKTDHKEKKIRIDVVSILLSPAGEVANVELLKDVSL